MKILSHGYVLLFNLLLIFSITVIINGDDETDYMFQLMKALSPTPLGWSNKTHHCKWKGISCNSTTQAVTSIILPSSSLTGTLPTNIHILTNLTHVDLHNNSLNGPLPDFSDLELLQTISLGHNKFSSVPDNCFQDILNLRTLNLSNNLNLNNWEFPMDDLSYSEHLETLDLEATNMIGKLDPDTFYGFENLQTFFISHNKLRGNPLQSLGQSPIRYLRLNNNKFDGTISFTSMLPVRCTGLRGQAWL
ncbi:non-specific serine/threonine protein kinase [Trifolium repens]|nr:non-specific serine/threonine protein kinase [Trifolium repens]